MDQQQFDGDVSRRDFIARTALIVGASALLPIPRRLLADTASYGATDVTIVEFSDAGVRGSKITVAKVVKSDEEWKRQLPPLAFRVARQAGTEYPFTGAYWDLHDKGIFRCVCCDNALFSSNAKFNSGTGWPSFYQPIAPENVDGPRAIHPGADASEVSCRRCDAHLGDIFNDGPRPTGLRYCIDSVSLRFVKAPE